MKYEYGGVELLKADIAAYNKDYSLLIGLLDKMLTNRGDGND